MENLAQAGGDVLFAVMPFGGMRHPGLGVSLLRGVLDGVGISSNITYYTLAFAQRLGHDTYEAITGSAAHHLIGEWVFSKAAFDHGDDLERLRALVSDYDDSFWAKVLLARDAAGPFIEECAQNILAAAPRVVAFTSTFQQHVASIALAKRLKALRPELLTIIGGANCEGPMGRELLRQCPFFDAVASGEADRAIGDVMAYALLHHRFPDNVAGIFTAGNVDDDLHPSTNPTQDLDALPYVRFDDFLEQYDKHFSRDTTPPRLLFETARGCWWGQKHHCTFCGLNGGSIAFRSKKAQRALDELDALVQAHPGVPIDVVDNILDMRYFQDFLPELARRENKYDLFYETKANLRKEQIRLLRDAGVTAIQPGIESLSTAVLSLMQKGISMLQNVQLLKWCKEFGVHPYWNVLWGFPGETPEEYARVAELIPKISHFVPPVSMACIRVDRFSPNYEQAQQRGFSDVEPYPAYAEVYPFPSNALAEVAYFFSARHADGRSDFSYFDPCRERIQTWRAAGQQHEMISVGQGDLLLIWDQRGMLHEPSLIALGGLEKRIYELCDGITTKHDIESDDEVRRLSGSPEHVWEALQSLVSRSLLINEGSRFLNLAVPVGDYAPRKETIAKFVAAARAKRDEDARERHKVAIATKDFGRSSGDGVVHALR